jgi:hypothetical protein
MANENLPAWRQGWTWTLIKCAIVNVTAALLGGVALLWFIRRVLDKLPGWLPEAWVRWLGDWVLRHVWFVGPVLGLLVGLVVSVGVVIYDAKKGRLTKLK